MAPCYCDVTIIQIAYLLKAIPFLLIEVKIDGTRLLNRLSSDGRGVNLSQP